MSHLKLSNRKETLKELLNNERFIQNKTKGKVKQNWGQILRLFDSYIGLFDTLTYNLYESCPKNMITLVVHPALLDATRILRGISQLLQHGFPDTVMTEWRTIYEIDIIFQILSNNDYLYTEKYFAYAISDISSLNDSINKMNQVDQDTKDLFESFDIDDLIIKTSEKYNIKNVKKMNWWAQDLFNSKKSKITFKDLESLIKGSNDHYYYKLASKTIHSALNPSKVRFGVIPNVDSPFPINGPTIFGLETPLMLTVIHSISILKSVFKLYNLNQNQIEFYHDFLDATKNEIEELLSKQFKEKYKFNMT